MGLPAERMSALLAKVQEMEGTSTEDASDHDDGNNEVDDQGSSDAGESGEEAQGESDKSSREQQAERPRDPQGKFVPGKRGPAKVEPTVQRVGQEPPKPQAGQTQQDGVNGIPADPTQWPDHPIPVSRFKPVLQERNSLRERTQHYERELQAAREEIQRLRSWQPQQAQQEQQQGYDPLGLFGEQGSQAASALPPEVQARLAKLDHLEREVQGLSTARAVEQLKAEIHGVISKYPETVTLEDMRDALRLNPRADMEDLAEALHHKALNWMNRGRLAATQQAPVQQQAQRTPAPPTPPRPKNTGSTGSANVESEVRSAAKDKTSRLAGIAERLKALGS